MSDSVIRPLDDSRSGAPSSAPESPPRVSSSSLLAGHDELEIEHDGQVYRLRKTALGKLILTK